MDRISRHSQGPEGVWFGSHWISSLFFADVVLLALFSQDLQHVLGQFAAECEAAGMKISTSKSTGKRWLAPSELRESSCLKWRSSSILGSCSGVREEWSMRLTERIRSRIQAAEMSFLRRVAGRSPRDKVRS